MNFWWLLRGAISHPSLQSTFVIIASCNRSFQRTLVAVISRSTAFIAVILWWTAWKIDCCVLAFHDGRIPLVAPRQYNCFPQHQNMVCCCVFEMIDMLSHAITSSPFGIWCKNTLVAAASCDTTCKIYFASLANDNKIVHSSQYDMHWFALCDTTWSLIARLLTHAIWWKMYYCCLLIAIQHKNKVVVHHRSRCYVVAHIRAMW